MDSSKTVAILGVNGFIGHHLLRRILNDTTWKVVGLDIGDDRVSEFKKHERFEFYKADMTKERKLVRDLVAKSDVVLPLAGIATPQSYINNPIRVFELDFEENLPIIRHCVELKKRVIWPSTSEVYGMSNEKEFHPDTSPLVLGPINKVRWIYSCSKQLMDRVIWSYGKEQGLDFTLFRPFNWIGIGLDSLDNSRAGNARVITQFLGNVLRGEDLKLVDGGVQRRSFTHADDCMDALLKIIENKDGVASGKIYNIGNPGNNHSIRELAEMILEMAPRYPYFREHVANVKIIDVPSDEYYGEGYQDVQNRIPFIGNTRTDLGWEPKVSMKEALERTFDAYIKYLEQARAALYAK